jgi:hypothetical protein
VTAIGHERENGRGLVNERECLVGFGVWTGHILGAVLPACRAGFCESVTLARVAVLNTRRGAVA